VSSHRRGFSLLEVMAVVAIVGLLLAIALPAIAGSQQSTRIQQTRAQFARFSLAVEGYHSRYGHYPPLPDRAVVALEGEHAWLLPCLIGQQTDGDDLSGTALTANPDRVRFLQMGPVDLDDRGHVIDAFGNPHWLYIWDHDGDGWIRPNELGAVPADVRPASPLPAGVYWCVQGSADQPWIASW